LASGGWLTQRLGVSCLQLQATGTQTALWESILLLNHSHGRDWVPVHARAAYFLAPLPLLSLQGSFRPQTLSFYIWTATSSAGVAQRPGQIVPSGHPPIRGSSLPIPRAAAKAGSGMRSSWRVGCIGCVDRGPAGALQLARGGRLESRDGDPGPVRETGGEQGLSESSSESTQIHRESRLTATGRESGVKDACSQRLSQSQARQPRLGQRGICVSRAEYLRRPGPAHVTCHQPLSLSLFLSTPRETVEGRH
jgi:hypothetical protein